MKALLRLTTLVAIVLSLPVYAKTLTAKNNGDWNSNSTWKGGSKPGPNDDVVIAGFTVTVNGTFTCKTLTINDENLLTPSSLTINPGGNLTCNGLVRLVTDYGFGSTGSILNVYGSFTANAGVNLENSSSQIVGIILGSTNRINIGDNLNPGTFTVNDLYAENGTTIFGTPTDINFLNLRNGTLAISGNTNFGDPELGVNGFYNVLNIDDSGVYQGKAKKILYSSASKPEFSQGRMAITNQSASTNFVFSYVGDLTQYLAFTNMVYVDVEVDKTGGELIVDENLSSPSFLRKLTVKSGSVLTFNKSNANLDALTANNSFLAEANARVKITGNAFSTALPSKNVANFNNEAIIDYYVENSEAEGEIFKESFNYPIVELTGAGTKYFSASAQNINGAGTTLRNLNLIKGKLKIDTGKELKLVDDADAGIVSLAAGTRLELLGDFSDLQTAWVVDRNSTFEYSSSSAQKLIELSDKVGNTVPYGIIELSNSGTKQLEFNKEIWVGNELKLGANTFLDLQENALVTLKSDIDFTAFVSEVPATAEINYGPDAKFVVEKYLPLPYRAYRDISSPIKNTTLQSWLNQGVNMRGFPGSSSPSAGRKTVARYNEQVQGNLNLGFEDATNATNPIREEENGKITKSVWRVLDGNNSNLNYFVTLKDQGEIYRGTQEFKLSFTYTEGGGEESKTFDDGWNQIGNPYPAPLDWDLVVNDPENINLVNQGKLDPTVYILSQVDRFTQDPNNPGYYGFYNSATGFKIVHDDIIPSYQGFWVKTYNPDNANTTFNLKVKEEHKADLQNSRFYKNSKNQLRTKEAVVPERDAVEITISENGKGREKIWFHYWPKASVGQDTLFDVAKFGKPAPTAVSVDFVMGNTPLNMWVNALPEKAIRYELPLYFQTPRGGDYTIDFKNLEVFTDRFPCAYLLDVVTGKTTDLAADSAYTFTLTEAYAGNRFLIYFNQNVASKIESVDAACFQENGKITFDLSDVEGAVDYSITNINTSQIVATIKGENLGFVERQLPAGQYRVRSNNGLLTCYGNTFRVDINQPQPVVSRFTLPSAQFNTGESAQMINQSLNATHFLWNFEDDGSISSEVNPVHVFNFPGTFEVSLTSYNADSTCTDFSVKTFTVEQTTSIGEQAVLDAISLTRKGNVFTVSNLPANFNGDLEVFTVNGQLLFKKGVTNSLNFELNNEAGLYIIRISGPDLQWTRKFAAF